MLSTIQNSITHAIMITGFVFMMMLVIEYLNVFSRGIWQQGLRGGRWKQYLLASFLGATPGCLGAFAVVSLYLHQEVSMGAVVAAMVATSGDESFVMLSMLPDKAPLIFLLLFVLGLLAGYLTDIFFGKKKIAELSCGHEFTIHHEENSLFWSWPQIKEHWHSCSAVRGILSITLLLFLYGVLTGQVGPGSWNWIRITLLLVTLAALVIVATGPDHFLEEHLWNHVAKKHVPKVFMWTFGALLLMHLLVDQLHLQNWLHDNQLIVLLVACLVGLIPESGPHLIFLTLFVEQSIPLSILLASSVVQDGHGMLPLLAESRIDFFKIKSINFVAGMLLGLAGYAGGW